MLPQLLLDISTTATFSSNHPMRAAARSLLLNRNTQQVNWMIQWTAKWHQQQTHRIVQLFRITDFDTILTTDEMHWCSVNISIDTTCDESLNWAAEKTHFNVCCCSYLLSVTTPQYCWQCSPSVIVRGQLSDLEWGEENFPGDILSSSWLRESPPWSRLCWARYSHGPSPWPALPWLSFFRYFLRQSQTYRATSWAPVGAKLS